MLRVAPALVTAMIAALSSGLSFAQTPDPFDPSGYLREQPDKASVSGLKEDEVSIGGRPFIAFRSSAGAIYLPKILHLTESDLEGALCYNELRKPKCDPNKVGSKVEGGKQMKESCGDEGISETTLARIEKPLSKTYVVYADAIILAIQKACGSGERQVGAERPPAALEIGIERKSGTDRRPKSEKVFIRSKGDTPSLKPEIGVGASF